MKIQIFEFKCSHDNTSPASWSQFWLCFENTYAPTHHGFFWVNCQTGGEASELLRHLIQLMNHHSRVLGSASYICSGLQGSVLLSEKYIYLKIATHISYRAVIDYITELCILLREGYNIIPDSILCILYISFV